MKNNNRTRNMIIIKHQDCSDINLELNKITKKINNTIKILKIAKLLNKYESISLTFPNVNLDE